MSDEVLTAAAVDLGASSGRVLVGVVGSDRLEARIVHRFPNEPVTVDGRLCWDTDALWRGVVAGLGAAGPVESVGVDTWAVDYGLLDEKGGLLGPPVHYRDSRTDGVFEQVRAALGAERLYETTGIQFMTLNTLYQLAAERRDLLDRAARLLLMPDLITYWLTGGEIGAERTNASTTQLYDVVAGTWSDWILTGLGLSRSMFPEIREPGTILGRLASQVRESVPGDPCVTTVASHDTASAVAAVPASDERFAYISCGTWSLVGVEVDAPVVSDEGMAANFTNEVGVDDTIRYLRNVTGLWLLQECLREWAAAGTPVERAEVLAAAAAEPARRSVFDAESAEFVAPGGMPERIREACRRTSKPVPETPSEVVRSILDSLAVAHARNVGLASQLSGQPIEVVHIVGGGAQNELLCQLTADACGLPVVAGPVEATALGNLLVQARAHGVLPNQAAARALVRGTQRLRHYTPHHFSAAGLY